MLLIRFSSYRPYSLVMSHTRRSFCPLDDWCFSIVLFFAWAICLLKRLTPSLSLFIRFFYRLFSLSQSPTNWSWLVWVVIGLLRSFLAIFWIFYHWNCWFWAHIHNRYRSCQVCLNQYLINAILKYPSLWPIDLFHLFLWFRLIASFWVFKLELFSLILRIIAEDYCICWKVHHRVL